MSEEADDKRERAVVMVVIVVIVVVVVGSMSVGGTPSCTQPSHTPPITAIEDRRALHYPTPH